MSVADAIVIGLLLGVVMALAWAVTVSWLVLYRMRNDAKPTANRAITTPSAKARM